MPHEPSSAELLALTGLDAAAWDRLLDEFSFYIFTLCRRAHVRRQDIADVTQDVFQSVARYIKDFHPSGHGGSFVAWLKMITHSRVVDHFRREERQTQARGGDPRNSPLATAWYATIDDGEQQRADQVVAPLLEVVRAQVHKRTWTAFQQTYLELFRI